MKKQLLVLFCMPLLAFAGVPGQLTDVFNFTGGIQMWTVPCGVNSVFIQTWGAQGGSGATGGASVGGGAGGLGGYAGGSLVVTPGQVLNVFVGGQGATPTGGFNGGGNGGTQNAGGGGGASDVRASGTNEADRVITAGGGGGGGRGGCHEGSSTGGTGGTGGAGGGGVGVNGNDSPQSNGVAGGGVGGNFGSVQGAGGAKGVGCASYSGTDGSTSSNGTGAAGGAGQSCCCTSSNSIPGGGGGGGGQLGGGGGGGGSAGTTGCAGNSKGAGGGGGGGSSYTGGVTSGIINAGIWFGNGMVQITYTPGTPQAPSFTTAPTSICANTPATFTVNTPALATSFSWTVSGASIQSGQGTNSVNIIATSASGSVSVTADNNCGSSSSVSTSFTVNAQPTVTASVTATDICDGDQVTFNGGGASSYTWNNGVSDGVAFTPLSSNNYIVVGTDGNNCQNVASVSVNVNSLPTVTANVTSTVVCSGESVTFTGGGASTYFWDNSVADGVAYTPGTTNTYTVLGTDANNCSNTASVSVTVNNPPTVTANSSVAAVCAGDEVTFTGSGADTYVWDNSVTDGVAYTPAATATYSVTGTDANNCSNTASVSVIVNDLPTVTATATPNTALCAGDSVVLAGGGATGYSWDNGVSDGVAFAPGASNTYSVLGTDANNCSSMATVSVTVNNLPTVVANASASTVCAGAQITFTGGGAATYVWDNGVTDGVAIAPASSNTYSVTGTDANNCIGTSSVGITVNTVPTVAISVAPNDTVCVGDNITLSGSGADTYAWSAGITDGSAFALNNNGTYTVTGTDLNNCTNTASVSVVAEICAGVSTIPNSVNGIQLIPNPSKGVVTITAKKELGLVTVYDAQGKVVFQTNTNGLSQRVDLTQQAAGIYMVKIQSTTKAVSYIKLVKE